MTTTAVSEVPDGYDIVRVPMEMIETQMEIAREIDVKRSSVIASDGVFTSMNMNLPHAVPNGDGKYKVAQRNGRKYLDGTGTVHLTDSNHTKVAVELRGHSHIDCIFHADASYEDAAAAFARQKKYSRAIPTEDIARNLLVSGDENWLSIKHITDSKGLTEVDVLSFNGLPERTLFALAFGTKGTSLSHLRKVLDIVDEVWPNQPERTRTMVLKAVSKFWLKYKSHSNLKYSRLVDKAGAIPIADLIVAAEGRSKLSQRYQKIDVASALRLHLVELHDDGKRNGKLVSVEDD